MAITTWSEIVDHTSDAGFRAWGKNVSDNLSTTSSLLTKTSDTGQIDWVTVTRPSIFADAGFEMYELTDALAATAPVFFKITYGTSNNAFRPNMKIQIGVETDGTGNFVGPSSSVGGIVPTFPPPGTQHTSYLSINEGFVGFVWQFSASSASSAGGGFMLSRTSTAVGTMSPDGLLVISHTGSTSTTSQVVEVTAARILPSKTVAFIDSFQKANSNFLAPSLDGNKTSFDGLAPQALIGWVGIPEVHPISNLAAVNQNEIAELATFSVALAGPTSRTYISMGFQFGVSTSSTSTTAERNYALCMLWE